MTHRSRPTRGLTPTARQSSSASPSSEDSTTATFEALSAERGEEIPCLLWCGHALFTEKGGLDAMSEHLRDAGAVASWAYAGWMVEQGKWVYSDPFYEETGRTIDPDLCHLLTARAAEDIARRIPELTGRDDFRYMHAVMGHYFTDYFSTPEEGTLDLLTAAIARPWAIRPPYFPDALDHRYAKAFADAVRIIAAHEDIIFDGEHIPVRITPASAYHRQHADMGGLWARGFEHEGRRLYCLFNFARDHEAFFTLKLDARGGGPMVLWDPVGGVHYSSSDAPELSTSDLSDGAFLHLGAARAVFLILEPMRDGADHGRHVDCRQVRATPEPASRRRCERVAVAGRRAGSG